MENGRSFVAGEPLFDALVVGAGPAGLTAALQLARFNRRVALFDAGHSRASYQQINHNYLGFPGGLPARELLELGRKQVREYPVAFVECEVVQARRCENGFEVVASDGAAFRGRTVVLATGVRDHFPLFPGWEGYVGRSLFWCIVCDGYSTRGKRIVIAGNDTDAGVTALQFLEFTSRVSVVTNAGECRLGRRVRAALQDRAIPVITARISGAIGTDGILRALILDDGRQVALDYLFSLQGQSPNTDLATQLGVACSPDGYILANPDQQTNVPGVLAAGDVTRALAHQVSTAVHEGNQAATAANYFLYDPALRHEAYEGDEP